MDKSPTLTIFTPSYNRAKFLKRLYDSLISQSDYDFEWLLVDDGSSDNTEEYMTSLIQRNTPFRIKYFRQQNGGKHRAINFGVSQSQAKWFFILDSDDWITPNAVSLIKKRILEIKENHDFCGIAGLRVTPDFKTIGTECQYDKLDSDFFEYRYKHRIVGDRAEVLRTEILREYRFPEFKGENFLGEAVVWNQIAEKYKLRYTSDKFYICEYQAGGLTDTFSKMMDKNPKGAMSNQLSIIKHRNCPILFWLLANYFYFKYRRIAQTNKIVIPRDLNPTIKMRITSILNPLIGTSLVLIKYLKKHH